jgi:hypothetical protein
MASSSSPLVAEGFGAAVVVTVAAVDLNEVDAEGVSGEVGAGEAVQAATMSIVAATGQPR